jgi:hypothetical protein
VKVAARNNYMKRQIFTLTFSLVALVTLSLFGCGGGGGGSTDPTPTPNPSATPSPQPSPGTGRYIIAPLDTTGYTFLGVQGISPGGSIVGSGFQTGKKRTLLWRNDTSAPIDLTPDAYNNGRAVIRRATDTQQIGEGGIDPSIGDTHALLWSGTAASVVDLHPAGFKTSTGSAIAGNVQGGAGQLTVTTEGNHALLWRGTAASVVDLHPSGYYNTYVSGVTASGDLQFGSGILTRGGYNHALLWRGTAASVVDLNSTGYVASQIFDVSESTQGGTITPSASPGNEHAALWRGTAASVVDLHPAGFQSSGISGVSGDTQVGYGFNPGGNHALVWKGTAASVVDLQVVNPTITINGVVITIAFSVAAGVDRNGNIVGSVTDSASKSYPVVWKPAP